MTTRDNLIEAIRRHEISGFKYPGSELLSCLAKYVVCKDFFWDQNIIEKCNEKKEEITQKMSNRNQKLKEGYIRLTEFAKSLVHKGNASSLSNDRIGNYVRLMPELFKDAYFQEKPRAEIFVHPQKMISLLLKYGAQEIKDYLKEYLRQQEGTCHQLLS